MAERIRPSHTTNDTSSSSAAHRPRTGPALPSARRNLFQTGQHTKAARRPVPAAAPSAASEVVHREPDTPNSETSEIVVRDRHGEIQLGEPPSPDLEDQDEGQNEGQQEFEEQKQRLADAVRHHQASSTGVHDQSEELLEAVRTSLRAKVASLSEDNWMYEREDHIRGA